MNALHTLLLFPGLILLTGCDRPKQSEPKQAPQQILPVAADIPTFDADQAFRFLKAQVDFGPRNPNSSGHRECLAFLQNEMTEYADAVNLQEFSEVSTKGDRYLLTNIISSFNLQATKRILLTAHWDTRPWADQDPNRANHDKPILGANDGASGVAVLLEIARHLKESPSSIGVDIVFFDGEDFGVSGVQQSYCKGSQYFSRNKPQGFHPLFAINLDMIGDGSLQIYREQYSEKFAPDIVKLIFTTARELGLSQFVDAQGEAIYDDHYPLNEAGIRAVDLIDFNYPDESNKYWHTMSDTPDKCSKESLEAVGKLLLNIVYSRVANL